MTRLLPFRAAQGTLLLVGLLISGQVARAQVWVATDFYGKDDRAARGVIDPDGKLISVGHATGVAPSGANGFAVTRHAANGTPDITFDVDGKAVVPNVKGSSDGASAVALQADGKILLAGNRSILTPSTSSWMIARLNANGSLDKNFASKGLLVKSLQNKASNQVATSLLIQPDKKIVAVGYLKPSLYRGAVIRLNANGSLDSTFGSSGVVMPTLPAYSWLLHDAVLQGDKILVAGYVCWAAGTGGDILLMRFNTNGSIDTTFGSGGIATAHFYMIDRAKRIALQTDGSILVATEIEDVIDGFATTWFGLCRFTANGVLDVDFGESGLVETTIIDPDQPGKLMSIIVEGMAIYPDDGRILLAGNNWGYSVVMARYLPDGSPDLSFGPDAETNTVVDPVGLANDLALDADGTLVLFGCDYSPDTFNDFLLLRYPSNGFLDLED